MEIEPELVDAVLQRGHRRPGRPRSVRSRRSRGRGRRGPDRGAVPAARARAAVGSGDEPRQPTAASRDVAGARRRRANRRGPPRARDVRALSGETRTPRPRCTTTSSRRPAAKIAHRVGDLAGYAVVDEADAERVLRRLVDQRIVRAGEDGAARPAVRDLPRRPRRGGARLADAPRGRPAPRSGARSRRAATPADAGRRDRRRAGSGSPGRGLDLRADATDRTLGARHATHVRGARRARKRAAARRSGAKSAPGPCRRTPSRSSRATEDVLRTTLRALRVEDVLRGGGPVADAGFSPDGKLVVTAGGGGEARDLPCGHGPARPYASARRSASGSVLQSGRLADRHGRRRRNRASLERPDRRAAPRASTTAARCRARLSRGDGRLLATTSADGTAKIWKIPSGRLVRRLDHGHAVKSASFSDDGRLLVTVLEADANDRAARVFDVRSGRLVRRLVQPDRVRHRAFRTHGRSRRHGRRRRIRACLARPEPKPPVELSGHKGQVLDAEFSPDGKRIVTASTDQTGACVGRRHGRARQPPRRPYELRGGCALQPGRQDRRDRERRPSKRRLPRTLRELSWPR